MNTPMTPPSMQPEYLFRGADRMRIEGCVNAISREHLSLALFAEHEALLDHYAELLVQRLRRLGQDLQVEVYFPTNTESLLARFNEALADQSMATAVQTATPLGPTQIWLVHDAQLLPAHELQLMARLIQNFPGANIRAVLLVSGKGFDRDLLSAFGRKILRWDIETPTPEQAQALLEQASAEGHGEAMERLVRRLGRQAAPSIETLAEQAQAAEDLMTQVRSAAQAQAHRSPGQPGQSGWLKSALRTAFAKVQIPGGKAPLRLQNTTSLTRWVLIGAGALLASALIMAWLQPQAFGLRSAQDTAQPQIPTVRPLAGAAAGVTLDSSPPSPTGNTPSTPQAVQASAAPTAAASGTAPRPDTVAPASSAPVDTAQGTGRSVSNPSQAQDSSGSSRNDVQQAFAAHGWVRGLDARSFVIQYGSSGTYAGAQALQQRYPSLANTRIIAITRAGDRNPRYAVVSGPYSPSTQAYDKLRNLGNIVPSSSWVRRTSDLQASLAPGRPQESKT
jgi:hypothetical protein